MLIKLLLLCFVNIVAGSWALLSILNRLVSTSLNLVVTLVTALVCWPWYVSWMMKQFLQSSVLFIMVTLTTVFVIRPCSVVYQVCISYPLYCIHEIALATFKQLATIGQLLFWLAKVVGPVVGILSVVQISFECSLLEPFKLQISQCASDASCLVLVHCRLNCSAFF